MPCQSNESHNIMVPEPIMLKNVSPYCMICVPFPMPTKMLFHDRLGAFHTGAKTQNKSGPVMLKHLHWCLSTCTSETDTVTIHSHSKRQAGRFPYGSLSQINLDLSSQVQLSCSIYQILKFNHWALPITTSTPRWLGS